MSKTIKQQLWDGFMSQEDDWISEKLDKYGLWHWGNLELSKYIQWITDNYELIPKENNNEH